MAIAMVTMRVGQVVAPSFVEGVASKGVSLRRVRIGRSSVWGSSKGLCAVKLAGMKVVNSGAPRADMSDREMPPSHRIKAASLSAFQEFQNARANRKCFALPFLGSQINHVHKAWGIARIWS